MKTEELIRYYKANIEAIEKGLNNDSLSADKKFRLGYTQQALDGYFQSYFSRYSSPKRNFLLICGLSTLCILRMMLGPSMLNPFFVIPFLICYVCMKHNKHISWMLRFWGRHSTNLWLVHTFFAYYLFHDFIYSFHYPILIYLVLLIISLGSSYVVRFIHHPIKSITNNLINCR